MKLLPAMKIGITAALLAVFSGPSNAQLLIRQTSIGRAEVVQGGGNFTGTWADDCAAANLHCVPFDDDGDVTAWLHNGDDPNRHDPTRSTAGSELVRFVPGGGCYGTGAVEMEDVEGTQESPIYLSIQTWPEATSGANIVAASDIEDVVPVGTYAWTRYCFSVSYNWLNNDADWAGNKISSWTGAYNTFTEQETFHMRIGGGPDAPRKYTSVSNTAADHIWEYITTGTGSPGDPDLQPGSEFGVCLYQTAPLNCYTLEPGTQYVVLIGAKLAPDTEDTTEVQVNFAKYGDVDWTRTYFRDDLGVNDDYDNDGPGGEEGYSALVFFNRAETNGDTKRAGITVQYSNILMHEGPTPPPLPDWDEWIHAPSWFTSETADRWGEIPGSDDFLDVFVPGSFGNTNEEAYNGTAVNPRYVYFCGQGGHSEQSPNGCWRLPLLTETPAWELANTPNTDSNPCSGGVADCASGLIGNAYHTGHYNDGSKTSDHTFSSTVATYDDCVYFPVIGGGWAPSNGSWGAPYTWKWCESDIANGEGGYTPIGYWLSGSLAGHQSGESASCYDPRNNQVLTLTQNWFQETGGSEEPNILIDLDDDSFTPVGEGPVGSSSFIVFCVYVPELDVFVAGTQQNEIVTCDASEGCPTWTEQTVSGTWNTGERKYHFAYSPAAQQILGWMGNTSQLRYITVPLTASDTWNAGTSNNAGGGVTPPAMIEDGPYSRGINIIQNFGGSGDDLLILWQNAEDLVNFQRIDGPRSAMFEIELAVNDDYYERRLAA